MVIWKFIEIVNKNYLGRYDILGKEKKKKKDGVQAARYLEIWERNIP